MRVWLRGGPFHGKKKRVKACVNRLIIRFEGKPYTYEKTNEWQCIHLVTGEKIHVFKWIPDN